jgi:hypothetical protein
MTHANVFPEMSETQEDRPTETRFVSEPHAAAPDPIMLEKIGKGLHELYDGVRKSALPIYFGPVLGELYLTPLPRRRSA